MQERRHAEAGRPAPVQLPPGEPVQLRVQRPEQRIRDDPFVAGRAGEFGSHVHCSLSSQRRARARIRGRALLSKSKTGGKRRHRARKPNKRRRSKPGTIAEYTRGLDFEAIARRRAAGSRPGTLPCVVDEPPRQVVDDGGIAARRGEIGGAQQLLLAAAQRLGDAFAHAGRRQVALAGLLVSDHQHERVRAARADHVHACPAPCSAPRRAAPAAPASASRPARSRGRRRAAPTPDPRNSRWPDR